MELNDLIERLAEQTGSAPEHVKIGLNAVAVAVAWLAVLFTARAAKFTAGRAYRTARRGCLWAFTAPPPPPAPPPHVPVPTLLGARILAVLADETPEGLARWARDAVYEKEAGYRQGRLKAHLPASGDGGRKVTWTLTCGTGADRTPQTGNVTLEVEGLDERILSADDDSLIAARACVLYLLVSGRLNAQLLPPLADVRKAASGHVAAGGCVAPDKPIGFADLSGVKLGTTLTALAAERDPGFTETTAAGDAVRVFGNTALLQTAAGAQAQVGINITEVADSTYRFFVRPGTNEVVWVGAKPPGGKGRVV